MPQNNLFDSALDWTGVRIELTDHTPDQVASFETWVQVKRVDGKWSSVHHARWEGLMVDLLDRFVTEVTHAWLYGNSDDVLRVAKKVHRDAGRHAVAHAYD